MHPRYCEENIRAALNDTPVVIISGPRQSGKTTLAKELKSDDSIYITLDDMTQYDAAKQDPVGFIRNLENKRAVIDEIQRVPDLFLAIKQSVDEDRRPGRFLLTGSSNALMLPTLSDSLAGRMENINLYPLTTCEIEGVRSTFLKKILGGTVPTSQETRVREKLINKILGGGFAEPLERGTQPRRTAWYDNYINSIVQKDLKDIGKIEHIEVVPKLVRLLASQVAQLTNYSEIASKLGITHHTVSHYIKLLEQLYLFERLPAWHKSESKRLIKTPKIHIVDSGLLCALRRLTVEKILNNPRVLGHAIENYVVNEIKRIATWHDESIEFSFYRDKDKVEIDLILETYDGKLIAIEVKAGATVTSADFNGLRKFQDLAGNEFSMGLILYDGDHSTQHGDGLYSVPIGCLWE